MCTVSMIEDHYSEKWNKGVVNPFQIGPSQAEFDALKKEVLEMKELLLRAKEYDKKSNQPDCEQEAKIAMLRKVAEAVGVDLDEIFGPKKNGLS